MRVSETQHTAAGAVMQLLRVLCNNVLQWMNVNTTGPGAELDSLSHLMQVLLSV